MEASEWMCAGIRRLAADGCKRALRLASAARGWRMRVAHGGSGVGNSGADCNAGCRTSPARAMEEVRLRLPATGFAGAAGYHDDRTEVGARLTLTKEITMKMRQILASVACPLLLCDHLNAVAAGYLVHQGTVVEVASTSNNAKSFAINIRGGTGPCADRWIVFPEAAAPDSAAHRRAYDAALAAVSSSFGLRVTVYNYIDNGCDQASFLQLSR